MAMANQTSFIGESQGGGVGLAQVHVIYGRAILQARQATGLISLEKSGTGGQKG